MMQVASPWRTLLPSLHVEEADAARAAVDHGHGLPVVRAQPLRLPEGQRDAGAAVLGPRAWPPVAVGRRCDLVVAAAGDAANGAVAGVRVYLGGNGGGEAPEVVAS